MPVDGASTGAALAALKLSCACGAGESAQSLGHVASDVAKNSIHFGLLASATGMHAAEQATQEHPSYDDIEQFASSSPSEAAAVNAGLPIMSEPSAVAMSSMGEANSAGAATGSAATVTPPSASNFSADSPPPVAEEGPSPMLIILDVLGVRDVTNAALTFAEKNLTCSLRGQEQCCRRSCGRVCGQGADRPSNDAETKPPQYQQGKALRGGHDFI
eukprot:gnl/TRDRNA2_/TRDRNA2_147043_c0_seq1.p1 gnl/TRDRNA2_/TRDRNA2_147043_c0~~gnl/TRDRNA2_/TRDRNA2_147043_c0_seq1.p1  ORF type:complete len:216 (+),score=43.48 gnl/TRDRNA2_/TRDRNA2_147043_c0_seq1:53-700(+)